jgi:chromosome segregation ATPase
MTVAMIIVGLLFGVALTVTLGIFAVLSMGGPFGENLRMAAAAIKAKLMGGPRAAGATSPTRSAEHDAKTRSLQEELRIMQRLMDKERVEREAQKEEIRSRTDEVSSLRGRIAERDERLAALQVTLEKQQSETVRVRDELAERSAELARARQQAKDFETELNVVQSGAGLSAVSDEIQRLRAQRDELEARLQRLTKPVTVRR